jgi:hypothetical protein
MQGENSREGGVLSLLARVRGPRQTDPAAPSQRPARNALRPTWTAEMGSEKYCAKFSPPPECWNTQRSAQACAAAASSGLHESGDAMCLARSELCRSRMAGMSAPEPPAAFCVCLCWLGLLCG